MSVLETLVKKISRTPYEWVRDEPTADDLNHILKEGLQSPSIYDSLNLRAEVYNDLKAGKAKLVTKRGYNAKVLAIVYPQTKIPWETFGKIFQAFGPFGQPDQTPWRLVWFAHPRKREFPSEQPQSSNINASKHIQPQHINGGYAYACAPETIVIYREEEVERVLVHELLHASCTDDMRNSEEVREVLTESWAELFLIAILANTYAKAKRLWAIQAHWIVDQETVLRDYNVNSPNDYAWRYTVGRRVILQGLGLKFPKPNYDPMFILGRSLRFTSPSLLE
jgi:hypothetical protein